MPRYDFPDHLVQAQIAWHATYQRLAAAAAASALETAALRRRLQQLSVQITADPYWAAIPGRAPAARMALKQLAWQAGR